MQLSYLLEITVESQSDHTTTIEKKNDTMDKGVINNALLEQERKYLLIIKFFLMELVGLWLSNSSKIKLVCFK